MLKHLNLLGITVSGIVSATTVMTGVSLIALNSGAVVPQDIAPSHPSLQMAQAEQDIVDIASASGSFTILVGLLEELGMAEDLRGYGPFTVFAPTDAAFQAVPDEVMQVLLSDRQLMAQVLAYHVVAAGEPLTEDAIGGSMTLRSLQRGEIEVDRRGGTLYVNEAQVVEEDIVAANGVIHAIDAVLIPPDVVSALQQR